MNYLLALPFSLFIFQTSLAETITFDIILFGNKIGYTNLTHEIKNDSLEFYTLDTKSRAKFLFFTIENHTRYEVVYKHGKLLSSKTTEIENGKTKRWTNVTWDGAKYTVDGYKGKRTFTEVPVFSVVRLFFSNITSPLRLFYESEADFNELKKGELPGSWEFRSSDGNRNIYFFKNGKITSTEFHTFLAKVRMIRTN